MVTSRATIMVMMLVTQMATMMGGGHAGVIAGTGISIGNLEMH
jgi:hypothetical protein